VAGAVLLGVLRGFRVVMEGLAGAVVVLELLLVVLVPLDKGMLAVVALRDPNTAVAVAVAQDKQAPTVQLVQVVTAVTAFLHLSMVPLQREQAVVVGAYILAEQLVLAALVGEVRQAVTLLVTPELLILAEAEAALLVMGLHQQTD